MGWFASLGPSLFLAAVFFQLRFFGDGLDGGCEPWVVWADAFGAKFRDEVAVKFHQQIALATLAFRPGRKVLVIGS